MSSQHSLRDLIARKRVVITVGSGGVGKTTTAAAVALAGARMGRRVLCLTIDPAKRLATSLGLQTMSAEAQRIAPELLGAPEGGAMTAMMLDVRRTFDELVARYASSPAVRDRIYANKIYTQVAGSLAGTPEYMAMEKLYALKDDPSYDLIVLDTPPTSNALDFLHAPDRMIGAMDSPTIRAFVSGMEGAAGFSMKLLSKAMAKVMSGLSQFTGVGFLEQVGEFLSDIQSLFGGFKDRAMLVREELKSEHVGFVVVTSPDPMAVGEAMFFSEELTNAGMRIEGLVVNRVRTAVSVDVSSPHRVANVLRDAGVEPSTDLAGAALRAHHDAMAWAKRDGTEVERVRRELRSIPRVIEVPAFDEDVYDIAALSRVSALLAP